MPPEIPFNRETEGSFSVSHPTANEFNILQDASYQIDKASIKVAQPFEEPDLSRERPNLERRLEKVADRLKEEYWQQLITSREKKGGSDHQQLMDAAQKAVADKYKNSFMRSSVREMKQSLLNKLGEEQKRSPLSLESRKVKLTEFDNNRQIFNEDFENSSSSIGKTLVTMETYRKSKPDTERPVVRTRFDMEKGTIFIEAAYKAPEDRLHLSEIIFQQYRDSKQERPSMPEIQKVTIETIHNKDTSLAMKYTGSGTFGRGSKEFALLQETDLVKAIRYLHHDHKESFMGNELGRITVDDDETRIESGNITCEFT